MPRKRKPTTDAVEILHRRYFEGRPEMLSMLQRIAAALNKRVELRFVAVKRRREAA